MKPEDKSINRPNAKLQSDLLMDRVTVYTRCYYSHKRIVGLYADWNSFCDNDNS